MIEIGGFVMCIDDILFFPDSGQYSEAMKHYLMLGAVATDFFTDPLNRNAFDEPVSLFASQKS